MWEQLVNTTSKLTGLDPLHVILLTAIGGGIVAVWRFMLRESRDSTAATNNNTSAMKEINTTMKENTEVLRGMKDEMAKRIKKATKP